MQYFREGIACSDLHKSPADLLVFARTPHSDRPYEAKTHVVGTIRHYLADLVTFLEFCRRRRRRALPASPRTLLLFVEEREAQKRPTAQTLAVLTAVNAYHRAHRLESPNDRELALRVRELRAAYKSTKATPFMTEHIQAMCDLAQLQAERRAARDRCLITLWYASAARPSELATLLYEDIERHPRGIRLRFARSKGDPQELGQRVTITPAFSPYCAISALDHWLKIGQIDGGYIFRKINRWDCVAPGERAIHPVSLRVMTMRYARSLRLKGRVCGYSFRRGSATQAAMNGADDTAVQRQLRHKYKETTHGYIDRVCLPWDQSLTGLVLP